MGISEGSLVGILNLLQRHSQ